MRSTKEIRDDIASHQDKMDSILAKAETEFRDDLTSVETLAVERAMQKVESLAAELKDAQAGEKERHGRAFNGLIGQLNEQMGETSSFGSGWQRDRNGNAYAILNKTQKATELLKPKCENEFGYFVLGKLFGPSRNMPDAIKATLSEGNNTLGGFLVPDRLFGEVIDLARAKSVLMRAGTRTIVMDSETLTVPKLTQDVTVATKAENVAGVASDVKFGARTLDTHTAFAMCKMSRELWEDSPDLLASQLANWMGSAMATQIDKWGIQGTGSAEPLGILNRAEIDDTGSIGAIDWLDITAAATAIRNRNHEPNGVILNTTIHDDLFTVATGDGTNAARGWLGPPPTISSLSYNQTTNCPTDKLVVGDFSKYAMGVRTGAVVEATTQAGDAFEKHQVWIKITQRFDFITLDDSAFQILTGITT